MFARASVGSRFRWAGLKKTGAFDKDAPFSFLSRQAEAWLSAISLSAWRAGGGWGTGCLHGGEGILWDRPPAPVFFADGRAAGSSMGPAGGIPLVGGEKIDTINFRRA